MQRARLTAFLILALLLFSACNMPQGTPTAAGVDLINTAAAQTVNARLTQAAQPPPQGGGTPAPTDSSSGLTPGAPASPPAETATPGPAETEQAACDEVKFVEDVTYPDNSEVAPGSTFVKTWRLENAGSCTWTTAYAVVFSDKDRMEAPDAVPLGGNVAPGQTVDVSVTLKAPTDGGTYRADFKLRNAANTTFGIGSKNDPFYVQIEVPSTSGGLGFDFIAQAAAATWMSGTGDTLDTSLTFGAEGDDPNGLAAIRDAVKLETGAVSGKVLLTVPKRDPNGVIAGTYPEYSVQSGDRLKGRLLFMTNANGNCGAGNVVFQIAYKEGDAIRQLEQREKTCDGSVVPLDIDLSSIDGKTVQFIFVVRANGAGEDDWAVWNSVRIDR